MKAAQELSPASTDSSLNDKAGLVLKHGDTFGFFDLYGDVNNRKGGEQGVYHDGTRFLSHLELRLNGETPLFLSSSIGDDNVELIVAFTNPASPNIAFSTVHLGLRKLLWHSAFYQELRIENHGTHPQELEIDLGFAADFADIYEIRGMKRNARGQDLDAEISERQVVLGYRGLDQQIRRGVLRFLQTPSVLTSHLAQFHYRLLPRQAAFLHLDLRCEQGEPAGRSPAPQVSFSEARQQAKADVNAQIARSCRIETSNQQFTAWSNRAASDLRMMTTQLPTGPYPYAGVPWFNTPFGRDGLLTALECLWIQPELSRGVLAYLASTQATESIPKQDADPGKILHETRCGEMAAMGEMPFARYYGSVDSTPLFIYLAGAYYERTGDRDFIQEIWANLEAALLWMSTYGDPDGDGFLEYSRQTRTGLIHQGWKDSDEAIFHQDGSPAIRPIALCEVQSYAYGAWRAGALLSRALGFEEKAAGFTRRAEVLRDRFDRAFWCEELSTYALALDGEKRPCRIRTSNAGQCLLFGIALPERARSLAKALLSPESFSGWGVRSVATTEALYNPMSYHNGGIWPHDNALIAAGLAKYGMAVESSKIFEGLFAAAMYFRLHRVPELFCGFTREPGEGPVQYPVACSPQAWSTASVFLLLQACLGLHIDGVNSRLSVAGSFLPEFLDQVNLKNLQVGSALVDLSFVRKDGCVDAIVLRQEGNVSFDMSANANTSASTFLTSED